MGSSGRIVTPASIGAETTLTTTATKTGNYTVAPWQLVPCDTTTGSLTLTLPAANVAGQLVAAKLLATTASNLVTISRVGTDVINVSSLSVTLSLANDAMMLRSSGAGVWTVEAGDRSLAALDARYAATGDSRLASP